MESDVDQLDCLLLDFIGVVGEIVVSGFPVVFMGMLEEVVLTVLEGNDQLFDLGDQSINILRIASDCLEIGPQENQELLEHIGDIDESVQYLDHVLDVFGDSRWLEVPSLDPLFVLDLQLGLEEEVLPLRQNALALHYGLLGLIQFLVVVLGVIELEEVSDLDLGLYLVGYFVGDGGNEFEHLLLVLVVSADDPDQPQPIHQTLQSLLHAGQSLRRQILELSLQRRQELHVLLALSQVLGQVLVLQIVLNDRGMVVH